MRQYLIKHNSSEPQRDIQKTNVQVMPFGKYKGCCWDLIPLDYLILVADDFNRDRPGVMPDQRFKYRVSLEVRERAREELKERGYKRQGQRWVYDR